MGKYIIEVGDAYAEYICGKGDMLCLPVRINEFEDNWLNTNIPLTPYTEPDTNEAYQRGYEEGYAVGEAKKNSVEDEAYQRGLNDAWEAARKIYLPSEYGGIHADVKRQMFNNTSANGIFKKVSASEAIEKIRKYEQEQEAIQLGDEVKVFERKPFIVTGFGYGDDDVVYCHGFVTENGISTSAKKDECVKTGRHFPEIATVLRKMKEES